MPLDGDIDPTAIWRADSLLPATATLADRVRERALRLPQRLQDASVRVGDILTDLPDEALPFVIYELGLEIVTPYVSDLRRVIVDGREWERVRGTPVSIEMALGWINVTPLWVEEHPRDHYWDLFQISLGEPAFGAALNRIIGLARLSKPTHMDLVRLYNPCGDRRTQMTDGRGKTDGGGLTDDWSGVWMPTPDGRQVKVAWCRKSGSRGDGFSAHIEAVRSIERTRGTRSSRAQAFQTDRDQTDGAVKAEPWWCQAVTQRTRASGTALRVGRRRPIAWTARAYGEPGTDVVQIVRRRATRRVDFATRICGTRVSLQHADVSVRLAPGRQPGPRPPLPYDRSPRFAASSAVIYLAGMPWAFDGASPTFDATGGASFDEQMH